MRKTILAFGASVSSTSVNQQLALFAASILQETEVKTINLAEYQCEIYSQDVEASSGIPQVILDLDKLFKSVDGFIISFAEHNYSYTAAYKNTFDWLTRANGKDLKSIFGDKPCLFLSCSPSNYGGAAVMETTLKFYHLFGARVAGSLSVPRSYETLQNGKLTDAALGTLLQKQVKNFENALYGRQTKKTGCF